MSLPRHLFVALAALALQLTAVPVFADEHAALRETLRQRLPDGARIGEIRPSPQPGLLEVVVNDRDLIYVDARGDLGFVGRIVDLRTRTNLTQNRLLELRKVDFGKLPLDKAIVKVKGNGSRKVAVFSDPDCPFCQQLEPELDKLENVTIYTFLYPLTSLHPDAMRKAALVWCSPDRVKAWDDLMLRGILPQGRTDCATPMLDIIQLAQQLGISGTPGLIFPNGQIVPGSLTREQLDERLGAAS
jgi:thiol:disulfide interchange protein DsbC